MEFIDEIKELLKHVDKEHDNRQRELQDKIKQEEDFKQKCFVLNEEALQQLYNIYKENLRLLAHYGDVSLVHPYKNNFYLTHPFRYHNFHVKSKIKEFFERDGFQVKECTKLSIGFQIIIPELESMVLS